MSICGHRVIAAAGGLADCAAIRALWPGGFHHRRLFDDPLRWFGRVAKADVDLYRALVHEYPIGGVCPPALSIS